MGRFTGSAFSAAIILPDASTSFSSHCCTPPERGAGEKPQAGKVRDCRPWQDPVTASKVMLVLLLSLSLCLDAEGRETPAGVPQTITCTITVDIACYVIYLCINSRSCLLGTASCLSV